MTTPAPQDQPPPDEIARLLNAPTTGPVSMLYPIELWFPHEMLEGLIRKSLHELQNRDSSDEPPEYLRANALAIQQRIDLLSWLDQQTLPFVLMAMYPAGATGEDQLNEMTEEEARAFLDGLPEAPAELDPEDEDEEGDDEREP